MRSIHAIVQARMGSARLPGKVLMDLGGRPVLAWVVEALLEADQRTDWVTVATSDLREDDAIETWCSANGMACYRGAVDDVLSRFIGVVDGLPAEPDGVMRITADCPLHDPILIKSVAGLFKAGSFDYVSTVMPRSLPRGLDLELIRTEVLRELDAAAVGVDRVHVTSYLHRSRHGYRCGGLVVSPSGQDLRVTLDTVDDAELLRRIVGEFSERRPSWFEIVELLRRRPDLVQINAHVQQKSIEEG